MIGWMRAHNALGGDIGFYGFDMQYPGMAIRLVETFVGDVDAGSLSEFQARPDCLAQVANDPTGNFVERYETLSPQERDACRANLVWVHDRLSEDREAYIAAGGEAAYEWALQSSRITLQYEAMKSGLQTRDAAMAENVEWLLGRLGPDARVVLWAHNDHVSYRPDRDPDRRLRPDRAGSHRVHAGPAHHGRGVSIQRQRACPSPYFLYGIDANIFLNS
jgi:erythromycin esterase